MGVAVFGGIALLGRAGKVAGWTLGTMVVGNSAYLLYGTIASSATAGRQEVEGSGAGVAGEYALNTATLIAMLPHSVVVLSIATVLFNQLSRSQAHGQLEEVRQTVNSGLRTIGVATMFGAAVMASSIICSIDSLPPLGELWNICARWPPAGRISGK